MASWKQVLGKSILLKRLARKYRIRTKGYPRWDRILKAGWNSAKAPARPKILVATSIGAFLPGAAVESLLAVALTLRQADVEILLCDAVLPACQDSDNRWHPKLDRIPETGITPYICQDCFGPGSAMYQKLGLPIRRYSEFLTPENHRHAEELSRSIGMAEIPKAVIDGVNIGEHSLAATLRFFGRGSLEDKPYSEYVLRAYFKAALLTLHAARRLFRERRWDVTLLHHGIYVPQGILSQVSKQEGARVVTWTPAYRKKCFIFSHEDTYHRTMMSEPISRWENIPWSPAVESTIMDYLKSRWSGGNDWIFRFNAAPQEDVEKISRDVGVDFSKPCVGMLTNVMWDAQLFYSANAFPSMLDWVLGTIAYFEKRPDLQLIIRIHPGELHGSVPSRQPILPEIRRAFPVLPKNVFLIPPESKVSTYATMAQCNAVLIYGTKTGVELTGMGIPVIVAGEAWIRNKGITIDAASATEYYAQLDRLPLPGRMSEEQTLRARRYAYHFFFRRMIPLEVIQPLEGWPPYTVRDDAFDALRPGKTPSLDLICRGILEGSEFIYPAERGGA